SLEGSSGRWISAHTIVHCTWQRWVYGSGTRGGPAKTLFPAGSSYRLYIFSHRRRAGIYRIDCCGKSLFCVISEGSCYCPADKRFILLLSCLWNLCHDCPAGNRQFRGGDGNGADKRPPIALYQLWRFVTDCEYDCRWFIIEYIEP